MKIDKLEEKDIWVVLQNTDLTEGRGGHIPYAVCSSETTALRLGKGNDVQGCDCRIERRTAIRIDNYWYGPVSSPASDRLRELEEDKARLDWLDSDNGFPVICNRSTPEFIERGYKKSPIPLRERIDIARKDSRP